MKTLFIALGTFLFTAVHVGGFGAYKADAQTSVKSITKDEPKTIKLKITGMTCAGCSNHVATALKALDGVMEQKVEYPGDLATVKYNPSKTTVADIIKAIEKLGYKAVTVSEKTTAKQS
ncbi:MAG: heavy-metal-associated domain-containing protein [Chitinophagaceae bacterium]|nr:heavy-metal-associated domain-containing protein [Chitinophagaceae bacterium]